MVQTKTDISGFGTSVSHVAGKVTVSAFITALNLSQPSQSRSKLTRGLRCAPLCSQIVSKPTGTT